MTTPVSLTLRTLSDQPGYAQVAQAIQAELAPIGIKVNIVTAPDAVNGGVIGVPKNHVPMGINTWTQDYPYPDDFFGPLLDGANITPTGNNNYASYNNPAVTKQIAELETKATSAQWNALDKQIIGERRPVGAVAEPDPRDAVLQQHLRRRVPAGLPRRLRHARGMQLSRRRLRTRTDPSQQRGAGQRPAAGGPGSVGEDPAPRTA